MPIDRRGLVTLVGRGNANIVVSFGDDDKILYRLSIRNKDSIIANNSYTLANWDFIQKEIIPRLGSYLCPMELTELELKNELAGIYSSYVTIETEKIRTLLSFKLPNLRSKSEFENCLYKDHQTVLYTTPSQNTYILEIKPKWLHNPVQYCRNCTHNKYKTRNINYCYRNLLSGNGAYIKDILFSTEVSSDKLGIMAKYFSQENNVLQKLYNEQLNTYNEFQRRKDDKPALLMTLRDVSCFVKWDFFVNKETLFLDANVNASIIDVDLKPAEKRRHWIDIENTLNSFESKVYH
ncbi:inositol-pentakisphosphate 2-kinase [Monosporozyma unispora]|nr:Inositol-pentakisphosphate 2-kinase [Kazachstania unispora]